jgi:hypothetical protein
MTGSIRRATIMTVFGLLVAPAAMAGGPSAANSTVPVSLRLGVYSSSGQTGAPNAFFNFSITVKDGNGDPVKVTPVQIDFSACPNLYVAQDQPFPGVTTACTTPLVFASTDNNGVANFSIVGSSINPGGNAFPSSPSVTFQCADVSCLNTHLAYMEVITEDMDYHGGVSSADLASEIQDVLYAQTHIPQWWARADAEADLAGASPFDNDSADIGKFIDIYLNVLVVSGTNGGSCGDTGGTCCP